MVLWGMRLDTYAFGDQIQYKDQVIPESGTPQAEM